jgi:hypothetical protein
MGNAVVVVVVLMLLLLSAFKMAGLLRQRLRRLGSEETILTVCAFVVYW